MALCLVGCESQRKANLQTQNNLANPEFVGELRGQKLYRAEIVIANHSDHWVYFFDNSPVMTINRSVSNGKTTYTQVEVIIGGKHYIAVEKE